MSYLPKIKPELMHQLWVMKKFLAAGPITLQIQKALNAYLAEEIRRIGMPLEDVEQAVNDWDEQKRSKRKELVK